jgi:hypothetical protein
MKVSDELESAAPCMSLAKSENNSGHGSGLLGTAGGNILDVANCTTDPGKRGGDEAISMLEPTEPAP